MKTAKILSCFFALLSAALILLTLTVSFRFLDAPVYLLQDSQQAQTQTAELMDAICRKDLDTASSLLLGAPALSADPEPESALAKLLWDAFWESLSYEFTGPCQASDSGLYRVASVTALDIPALMGKLKDQAQELLKTQADAQKAYLVYNADGSYREDFVMEVLTEAAEGLLQEDSLYSSRELTLHLELHDGQWQILPDAELIQLLCGSVGK